MQGVTRLGGLCWGFMVGVVPARDGPKGLHRGAGPVEGRDKATE